MRFLRLILPALLCASAALAQPTITSITNAYGGFAGNGPGAWTVTGTGFSMVPKETRFVDANNADIFTSVSCTSATTCDIGGLRQYRVPDATAQNLGVFALVNGSKSASSVNFMYYAPPIITSLTPPGGAINVTTDGTVNGGPFTRAAAGFPGTTSVYIYFYIRDNASGCGSTTACAYQAKEIQTDLSASQGAYSLSLTTPGGNAVAYYLYGTTPATPTITSINPSGGPSGGANVVTITGTNLHPVSTATRTFQFTTAAGTFDATSISCSSNTTCTATVPAGAAGPATVTTAVTCPASTACAGTRASNSIPFTASGLYTYDGLKITASTPLRTSENGQSAQFSVALHTQPANSVHVDLSTSGGRATLSTVGLDFTSSNWATPQVVTVTGIDDTGTGGSASPSVGDNGYNVTLMTSSPDLDYHNLNVSQSLTNVDNDSKKIYISPTSGLRTHRGGGTATFNVVLTAMPSSNVTINLHSNDTLEGTVSPTSLSFTTAPGGGTGWNVPRTVTVTGVPGGVTGKDVLYSIVSRVLSSDATYAAIITPDVEVTNEDAPPSPPTNVVATATSGTSVNVTWTPTGATLYEVGRSSGGAYTSLGMIAASPFTDNTAFANNAYLYAVRAIAPEASAYSTPDLATTTIFTDTVLTPTVSQIRAVHMNEVRTAINAVRILSGMGGFSFTNPVLSSSVMVYALHINEARTALNAARSTLGLPAVTYTRPTITAGSSIISAVDVTDLRNGVK